MYTLLLPALLGQTASAHLLLCGPRALLPLSGVLLGEFCNARRIRQHVLCTAHLLLLLHSIAVLSQRSSWILAPAKDSPRSLEVAQHVHSTAASTTPTTTEDGGWERTRANSARTS